MKKVLFCLLAIFTLSSGNLFSQCLCSEIGFKLVLPEVTFNKDTSNYSVKVFVAPRYTSIGRERKFHKSQINGDTLNFSFPTGGGIDTLTFAVRNLTNNSEMLVTALHMTYDNFYFIDLTTFTPGHFLFDWKLIDKCQKENKTSRRIDCNGLKLYQLKLVDEGDIHWKGFVHNEIRVESLHSFERTGK